MDHPFFIVSTYLWLFPFVALVGFATLFTLLPFTTSRPFDASKLRFCWQHISCQQHTYHCYHCFHNLILMFKVTDRPYLFSCLLCLSSASRLQLRHHIVLYWVHKWSFHLHPICYYLPLSTTDYRHFFLHVVSQITLLAASLFELAVYKFLIRLLFMFMSPWKVSEPLSMLFAMVLTFVFITGICCTWWIPKINNVSTVHMPSTCHYLSSIRLWNSWKVCRITTTRWPLWPSITFIRFRSLCSSVPFITLRTFRTGVSFVTFWTLRTNISFWSLSMVNFRTLRPRTTTTRWPLCTSISFVTSSPLAPVHHHFLFRFLSPLSLFWTSIALITFWSLLPCWPFNNFHSCTYFAMISNNYTHYKICFMNFSL